MIQRRDIKHLMRAIDQARLSSWHPAHVGAVLAHGKRLISHGFNRQKTHPRSRNVGNSIHAELDAVLRARTDLEGTTCYIARVSGHGGRNWAMARPCHHCEWLLRNAGIRRVVYTVSPGVIRSEYLI